MKLLKNIATVIGMIALLSMMILTSCQPYPFDEMTDGYRNTYDPDFREDIISINNDGIYTKEVWSYAERSTDYFIVGLSSAENKFLAISMNSYSGNSYYNEQTPSSRVITLAELDIAAYEIQYQNANTGGAYRFSEKVVPVVYNGRYAWMSPCEETNAILLIYGKKDTDIRPGIFWGTYQYTHSFLSDYALRFQRQWSNNSWNFQLRND